MCWNKGRLCWKIAKLYYFCHLKKLVRPETFGPYYVYSAVRRFSTLRRRNMQKQRRLSHKVLIGMQEARKNVFLEKLIPPCQCLICGIPQQWDSTAYRSDPWLSCHASKGGDPLVSETDEKCWGGLNNVTWHKLFDVVTDSILGSRRISVAFSNNCWRKTCDLWRVPVYKISRIWGKW